MGRSAGMVFSLFAFAAYYNLLNVGQSWVASGKVSLAALLCLLHGGIFAAALGALLLRHWGGWLPRPWARQSAQSVPPDGQKGAA